MVDQYVEYSYREDEPFLRFVEEAVGEHIREVSFFEAVGVFGDMLEFSFIFTFGVPGILLYEALLKTKPSYIDGALLLGTSYFLLILSVVSIPAGLFNDITEAIQRE